jgi:hypothetical protein
VSVSTCADGCQRTAAILVGRAEAVARRWSPIESFKPLSSKCWRNQISPRLMWLGGWSASCLDLRADHTRYRIRPRLVGWRPNCVIVKRVQFDSIVTGTRQISRHELPADRIWLGCNRRGDREHAGSTVFRSPYIAAWSVGVFAHFQKRDWASYLRPLPTAWQKEYSEARDWRRMLTLILILPKGES